MNAKYKYLLKNTGLLTISNFSSKILVFLLVPLYTCVLSPSEYGIYDLIISTVTLLYPILTINIVDAVMRFSMDKKYDTSSVACIGIKYVLLSCIALIILVIPVHYIHVFSLVRGYELFIVLYYISYVFNQYFIQLAKGLERVKLMAISGLVGTVTLLSSNLILLLIFNLGLIGFFLASILSQFIPVLVLSFGMSFHKILQHGNYSYEVQKNMILYCAPLIFTTIGWWINSASDKYVVTILCGVAANGVLSISYKIPSIVNTVFGMFGQAWQISAIKEYGQEESSKFYGDALYIVNTLMCCICLLLIVLSKPLASLLYANEFYEAWKFAPFLLCSSVLNAASGMLGPILSAKKDSKSMARSAIWGAIVNVILNIVLIWFIGVQGATLATIISAYVIYYIRRKAIGNAITIPNNMNMMISWIILLVVAILEVYFLLWRIELLVAIVLLIVNFWSMKGYVIKYLGVKDN